MTELAVAPLVQGYLRRYPEEVAASLSHLPSEDALGVLSRAPAAVAARVFAHLPADAATALLEQMDGGLVAGLLPELDPSHAAALLARLDIEPRQDRLSALPHHLSRELEELIAYPGDSAGHLMDPRVTTFRTDDTVAEALARIRQYRDRRILDLCLVDGGGRLVGVLPLQDVAVADPDEQLGHLNSGAPVSVQALAPRDEVVELLETRKLSSLPVVGYDGRLLGVIRYDGLVAAAQHDATEDMQAMVGAGREERALSHASLAIRKRLPWLQINLGTAFLAASVVGLFEDTIARFTALAVFLPVVAGQSGNTGAQALAVTMRGLALREIRVRNWFRVALKEVAAGFVNGCVVALTTALVVYVWSGSTGLPLVLGVSMVFAMVMAGLSGALIPVVLTAFRQDPAQSASIILTTVTDVVGFMTFLGLATLLSGSFGVQL